MARSELTFSNTMPIWLEGVDVLPVEEVLDYVLHNAGARPWDRDAIDERIVQSVRDGTGHVIDSQDDVGGYPDMPASHRTLGVPEMGVETWLESFVQATGE
jgi:hypothetical protein